MRKVYRFHGMLMCWNTRCCGSPCHIGTQAIRGKEDDPIRTLVEHLETKGRSDEEAARQ